MSLENFYLTDAGNALLARAQAGEDLIFTRAQVGEGTWPAETTYANITALVSPVKYLGLTGKSASGTQTKVGVQFTNSGVGRAFSWTEFAMWAADPDYPDDRDHDILYGTAYAGNTPVPISATLTEFLYNVLLKTDRATSITVVVDSSLVYLTQEDAEALIEEKIGNYTTLDDVQELLDGQIQYVTGAALTSGAITLPAGTQVSDGAIIKVTAPGDSEDVTEGISIDGETYPIINSMGEDLTGQANVWASGAILALLIDKDNKKAYLMNGGVSEDAVAEIAEASIQQHNEDISAHPDIRQALDSTLKATIQVSYNGG